jgi:hypothetical protein
MQEAVRSLRLFLMIPLLYPAVALPLFLQQRLVELLLALVVRMRQARMLGQLLMHPPQ